jgi:outer membrane immunogenic protein
MNRSLLGAAALLALLTSRSAEAADLSAAPVYVPVPSFSWTGFYAGAHVGGAWDRRDVTIYGSVAGNPLASGSTNSSSVMGGGQVGFNYSFDPGWMMGAEADVSGSDLHNSIVGGSGLGQRDNKIDAFGTVRARVGYTWNNWLLYGTGGFAWADQQMTRTQLIGTVNNAPPGTVESASGIGVGWAAGAGLEWAFAGNWTARIEYLHLGLGTQSFLFPLAAQRIDPRSTIDIARFGVNYKFD